MKRNVKKLALGSAMAAVMLSVGAVSLQAFAADNNVDANDPVLKCEGELAPKEFDCKVTSSKTNTTKQISLTPVRVTVDVLGCSAGSQPVASRTITYEKSAEINIGGAFGIERLPGGTTLLPGIGASAGVSVAASTTLGNSQTFEVGADYGMVSHGVFAQDAIEAFVDMTVTVREPAQDVPSSDNYTGFNVPVITPIVNGEKLAEGSLATSKRPFANLAEFTSKCPAGSIPPPGLA
jgi:hypothetical protein